MNTSPSNLFNFACAGKGVMTVKRHPAIREISIMTLTDKLIPYYYWFKTGFGEISIPIAFINMSALIITMITVKGFYISMWFIPIIGVCVIVGCSFVGWFFVKFQINSRTNSMINTQMNPEIKQISDDVKQIKNMLETK